MTKLQPIEKENNYLIQSTNKEHIEKDLKEKINKLTNNIPLDKDINKQIKNVYSKNPHVYTIDNYLTDEECSHMISLATGKLKKSLVSGAEKGFISSGRTGSNCWIEHDTDEITIKIGSKISKLVGLPIENAEAYQLIYYDTNQEYRRHYDGWIKDGSTKSRRNMKFGGQRMITALCYLNEVEEGGGTNFPRLNLSVNAKKRRITVFQNVLDGTDTRHELSEHAGMPVIKGEKWAFNLWFREESRKKLFNYKIDSKYTNSITVENQDGDDHQNNMKHTNNDSNLDNNIKLNITDKTDNNVNSVIDVIDEDNSIITINNFITENQRNQILEKCDFNDNDSSKCWIKNKDIPFYIQQLQQLCNISSIYYENLCAVKYKTPKIHDCHFDAWDLDTDIGKQNNNKRGQRLITITLFLTESIKFEFPKLNRNINCMKNSILIYRNTKCGSNNRNENMIKKILSSKSNGIIATIYVRERDPLNSSFTLNNDLFNNIRNKDTSTDKPDNHSPVNIADSDLTKLSSKRDINYISILETVYSKFKNLEVFKNGHDKMLFTTKTPWNELTNNVNTLYTIRKNNCNSILNLKNLNKFYKIDETTPVVIENVYLPNAMKLFTQYFKENIKNNRFKLGDKQSNRYTAHNEPLCRFMQYEILPLIETIVRHKLEPTYTYLSCYQKGADLPPHTDRPDCEYTVSFLIDKPENSNWNIYLDKEKQPVKGKGRYHVTPDKSQCIPIDCNKNGLMIFQGQDHIHFREELKDKYYNIVLLHFKKTS